MAEQNATREEWIIHTDMYPDVHTCIHTYIHAYNIYIHTNIHTCSQSHSLTFGIAQHNATTEDMRISYHRYIYI